MNMLSIFDLSNCSFPISGEGEAENNALVGAIFRQRPGGAIFLQRSDGGVSIFAESSLMKLSDGDGDTGPYDDDGDNE